MTHLPKKCIIIISLVLLYSPNLPALTCNPGNAITRAEWTSFGKIKDVIYVAPFANQSKNGSNEWLQEGLAELMGDLLQSGKKVGVVKGLLAKYRQTNKEPDYIVNGAYQELPDELRIFVKLFKKGGSQRPAFERSFTITPPNSGRIFIEMALTAKGIFDNTKLKKKDAEFEAVRDATNNFLAWESYIKGLQAMWKFDANFNDVAEIWFKESRKNDIYYQFPYNAQENLYGWLAVQSKIEGKPYSFYLEKLETLENERRRYTVRPSPVDPDKPKVIKEKDVVLANRFLKGNVHYLAGMAALRSEDLHRAQIELEKAHELVPEDTVTARQLYNVYTRRGKDKEAVEILNAISVYGLCM